MSVRKKTVFAKRSAALAETIGNAARGLYYTSETDAEIEFFIGGRAASVTAEVLLKQIGKRPGESVEQINFRDFFDRLTKTEDWHGAEEQETSRKFIRLRDLLEENLKDLQVFKVGRIELEIYAVGLDESGRLAGIKTEAVET